MKLDMNKVWTRCMVLVRENFQLLAVIAGVFILLPTMAMYFLIPGMEAFVTPGADPEVVQERMLELIGPLLTYGLIGSVIQFVGYGAMVALMGENRPTVGEALGTGAKSMLSVIGAFVIFFVLYMVAAIVIVTPIAMLAGAIGVPGLAAIAPLFVIAIALFLMARFSLTMPVIVVEHMLNPLKAVKRSWDLTGPSQWGVLGFWLILGVAYMVISLLLLGVFGVIAALAGDGTTGMLILGLSNGLISMVVSMVLCGLAVAMHAQLAGPSEKDIAATFD